MEKKIASINEESNGEKALKILYMLAYFAPAKSIHLDMLLCVFNDIRKELDAPIQLLKKKYLIVESNNQQMFLIEKQIQKEIRTFLKQNNKEKDSLREAVNLQTFHLLKDDIHLNYIDHTLSLLVYIHESGDLVEISVGLPSLMVMALRKLNRLLEAYVFGNNALTLLEKALGETHAEILNIRHNLANVLDVEGQHTEAAQVLKELIEKDLKYSSVDELTRYIVHHARRLCKLSRYKDALSLYQILIGEKSVLDTFDSETLTTWNDYAVLLSHMGRHSEASEILQNVLLLQRRVLVEDDEFGLLTRQRLANVFREQGNYVRALEEIKEVFRESTKFHGELYSDTLRAERDLCILLLSKGDHKEALLKLEDVEKKFKQNFTEPHPDILCTRANIALALMNLNECNRALQISEDVYEGYKNIFGEKHNETSRAKYNIGTIYLNLGKSSKAAKCFRDVYEGFRDIFGSEHNKTLTVRAELEKLGYFPTALDEAVQRGDLNKVVSLIENGEDVNKADAEGRIPLHYAALNGHISVAKHLLKMGAMHNAQDFGSATPYQLASDEQMKDLLNSVNNLFIDVKRGMQDNIANHKGLTNARDKNGYSLLHWALYKSHKQVIRQLLEAGVDLKCISLKGFTLLHVASSKGHKEMTEILLQSMKSNDLNYFVNFKTTVGGNTALHVAAKHNDLDIIKCLLFYGGSYDIKNNEGLTPVQLSTNQTISDLLNVLQEMFSSVQEGNSKAITLLKSMNNDNLSIVKKTRNSQGHTLLQVAIKNQNENFIYELL
ncbi:unnamed protein product [Larinioides sclopetarius]|uniref:Uncharacterized protein n=1 Tax=Larinioides sclopetarius TaxID=280406 RepID=A0AAV1ZEJ4_9ARAC